MWESLQGFMRTLSGGQVQLVHPVVGKNPAEQMFFCSRMSTQEKINMRSIKILNHKAQESITLKKKRIKEKLTSEKHF